MSQGGDLDPPRRRDRRRELLDEVQGERVTTYRSDDEIINSGDEEEDEEEGDKLDADCKNIQTFTYICVHSYKKFIYVHTRS